MKLPFRKTRPENVIADMAPMPTPQTPAEFWDDVIKNKELKLISTDGYRHGEFRGQVIWVGGFNVRGQSFMMSVLNDVFELKMYINHNYQPVIEDMENLKKIHAELQVLEQQRIANLLIEQQKNNKIYSDFITLSR